MTPMIVLFCAVLAFLPAGCASQFFPSAPAPEFFQAAYPPRTVTCPRSFTQGVRVWAFSASAPYDRPEMVIRKGSHEVLFSTTYQWVTPPGTMVAESLYRDLAQGPLFSRTIIGADPTELPLALTGRIFTFAWEREGEASRAVLRVEATLAGSHKEQGVYFHKNYTLTGEPVTGDTPAAFAAAMGELVGEFSQSLQKDLCTVAAGQSPPQASP